MTLSDYYGATDVLRVLHSELPTHQYNLYSDATMDKMLESLENILDEVADPEYEVEYGVRQRGPTRSALTSLTSGFGRDGNGALRARADRIQFLASSANMNLASEHEVERPMGQLTVELPIYYGASIFMLVISVLLYERV